MMPPVPRKHLYVCCGLGHRGCTCYNSSTCWTGPGTPTTRTRSGTSCAAPRRCTTTRSAEVWGIFKHADVLAIEKDPKTFSSHRAPRPHGEHLPMMISMDDPEHQRRRSLVSRGFTPKRVSAHEPMVRELCPRIINGCASRAAATSCGTSPRRYRCYVIADLLGYEPDMYDDLLRWSEELMSPTADDMTTPEQIAQRLQSRADHDAVPRGAARDHRRPAQAPARRRHHDPLPGGDRRRTPRRRVDRAGDAADPHRRRRDDPARAERRDARADQHPDQRAALRRGAADMALAARR